jgi:ABC-type sugar transport system substrate-binding protein
VAQATFFGELVKTTLTHTTLIAAALLASACAPALAQASKATHFTGLGVTLAFGMQHIALSFAPGLRVGNERLVYRF